MWVRLTIHLKAIVSNTFRLYVILRYKKPFQLLTSTSWWKSVVTAEKRALKNVKLSCLKVSCWKQNKYVAPHKRKILQPSPTCTPSPHKKLGTLKSCIFTLFGRITFKLGNFLNVKALFQAVSTVLGQMIPTLTTLNFGAVLCRGIGYGAV